MGAGLDIHLRRRDGSAFPADIALSPIRAAGDLPLVIAAIREKVGDRRGRNLNPEPARIERDLHERALQTLFALSLNLQTMAGQVPDQALSDRLQRAVEQVDDVARDLRNFIFGLRPGILSDSPGAEDSDTGSR